MPAAHLRQEHAERRRRERTSRVPGTYVGGDSRLKVPRLRIEAAPGGDQDESPHRLGVVRCQLLRDAAARRDPDNVHRSHAERADRLRMLCGELGDPHSLRQTASSVHVDDAPHRRERAHRKLGTPPGKRRVYTGGREQPTEVEQRHVALTARKRRQWPEFQPLQLHDAESCNFHRSSARRPASESFADPDQHVPGWRILIRERDGSPATPTSFIVAPRLSGRRPDGSLRNVRGCLRPGVGRSSSRRDVRLPPGSGRHARATSARSRPRLQHSGLHRHDRGA